MWGMLADDIKAEIICRIPEKIMIRLKLVSKEWHSLISSICIPRISPPCPCSTFCGFIFPQVYTNPTVCPGKVIRFAGDGNYRRFSLNYSDYMGKYSSILKFELKPGDIQDCCNGIVLVVRDGVCYVCNPTTYECIHIPFKQSPPATECFASLAFDPTKSLDFKIISSDAGRLTNPQRLDFYSSETGEWSSQIVHVDDKLNGVEWGTRSVYFNGVVYRMLMAKYLLCIDLGTKTGILNVREIELPKDDNIEDNGTIGTSRGCFYYSNNDKSRLQIWMLKDNVGWIPRVSVAIDDVFSPLLHQYRVRLEEFRGTNCFKFLAFHPNCDEIFLVTPNLTIRYHFGNHHSNWFHAFWGRYILAGQDCFLPYSRCSILLKTRDYGTKSSK